MAQFQVYLNARNSRHEVPYLLDVQSDIVDISTRLVIPLVDVDAFGCALTRLNPRLNIDGVDLIMSSADLAGVPNRSIGAWKADFTQHRNLIMGAIDFLITGY